jgi:hypothetical protein
MNRTELKTTNTRILNGAENGFATWIATIKVKDWFSGSAVTIPIRKDDVVVIKYNTISDGVKLHVEAKETIAICKRPVDADLIFYNYHD